ncbi:hypothetical protein N9Z92_00990 [Akkermansiaceae bacterium]|nr:hypothetical protein [bacterium]MDB4572460.1 hypothetical protein [Akkermansiaceae bacterium]
MNAVGLDSRDRAREKGCDAKKGESKEGRRESRDDFPPPLCNLYVSLANPKGVLAESFADGSGELGGFLKI